MTHSIFICSLVFSLALLRAAADPLKQWQWRNPKPQGNALYSVGSGGEKFIAVGIGGTILVSTNGLDWQQIRSGTTDLLAAVAYGQGKYVLGGQNGTILYSVDTTNWTKTSSSASGTIVAMIHEADSFIGVTDAGWLVRSSNAVAWTREPVGGSALNGLAYGNGMLALCGGGRLWTKTNETNWSNFRLNWDYIYSVCYGADRFVAVGQDSIFVSTDLTTWERVPDTDQDILVQIIHTADGYVAAGYRARTTAASFYVSSDGFQWQRHDQTHSHRFDRLAYANGNYVAVGRTIDILRSSDTVNWPVVFPNNSVRNLDGIAYGKGSFFAIGDQTVLRSTNGIDWETNVPPLPSAIYTGVAYGNGRFVVSSIAKYFTGGRISSGTGGMQWDVYEGATNMCMWSAVFANGHFLVTGDLTIFTSRDGVEWQRCEVSGATHSFLDVTHGRNAFGQDMYVAVGGGFLSGPSTAGYSYDLTNWLGSQVRSAGPLWGVAAGNGVFVAVGAINTLIYSTDGVNWSNAVFSPEFLHTFMQVRFADGQFVALGYDPGSNRNFLYTSIDGINWNLVEDSLIAPYLRGLIFHEGRLFAVGDQGVILESGYVGWPRLSMHKATIGSLEIDIGARQGSTCRLQSATNLLGGEWATEAAFTNAPERTWFLVDSLTGRARYFRIAVP